MKSEQNTDKKINAEWRFLARRVLDLCAEISDRGLLGRDPSTSSEGERQLAAFVERRESALTLLGRVSREPHARPGANLAQLRRLVSGLECSRSYFVPAGIGEQGITERMSQSR